MQLQHVIILCAVIAVVGGGVWFMTQPDTDRDAASQAPESANATEATAPESESSEIVTGVGSLQELLALGDSFMCTYTVTDENTVMEGTSYIDGSNNRYRMDGLTTLEGQTGLFGAIVDGEYMYWWGDTPEGKMGMKVPVTEETSPEMDNSFAASDTQAPFDLQDEVSYECERWTVDASLFVPPPDVEFTDMTAMMEAMPEGMTMPTGMPGAQ